VKFHGFQRSHSRERKGIALKRLHLITLQSDLCNEFGGDHEGRIEEVKLGTSITVIVFGGLGHVNQLPT
jgi:hypothetical protein